MRYTDCYFVDRSSGTYSDACEAFGLAYILSRALQDANESEKISIASTPLGYQVRLPTAMSADIVDAAAYPAELLRVIQDERTPDGPPIYPLREHLKHKFAKLGDGAAKLDLELAASLETPHDLDVVALIEQLQGDELLKRLAWRLWHYRSHYNDLLRVILQVYSETPNRLSEGRQEFLTWRKDRNEIDMDFRADDTLLAIFSPSWQKSVNAVKPLGAKNENTRGFWLPEYLKIVGMHECALVVSVRSGNSKFREEDKKVYVVAPSTIDLLSHTSMMKGLRSGVARASSVKADILVLFKYIDELLKFVKRSGQRIRSGRVTNIVEGFHSAYFKRSSRQPSSLSITNIPFLNLPTWINFPSDPPTEQEIADYQYLIESQREVIFYRYIASGSWDDFLDEDTSEGYGLLKDYRDFLSCGHLDALLDFYAGFASRIMQQASRQKPDQPTAYKQFKITDVRRLIEIMAPTLGETLEDDGFREIARAIRLCTITAQRLKAKNIKTHHEIRYGLAQELKRKAQYKIEFTTAIMEFINRYQAENARARERGKKNIHEVTTEHVRRLASLIDRCAADSAEPVASLLLAFGYAYDDDPKEEEFGADETQTQGV